MAYINTDEVKAIRNELKVHFPHIKFSVKKGYNGSSVDVSIMASPYDFKEVLGDSTYAQINHYHLYNYGDYESLFNDILTIIKTAPAKAGGREWFDKSDIMTDYFHTAYYMHINVGAWDKPYKKI